MSNCLAKAETADGDSAGRTPQPKTLHPLHVGDSDPSPRLARSGCGSADGIRAWLSISCWVVCALGYGKFWESFAYLATVSQRGLLSCAVARRGDSRVAVASLDAQDWVHPALRAFHRDRYGRLKRGHRYTQRIAIAGCAADSVSRHRRARAHGMASPHGLSRRDVHRVTRQCVLGRQGTGGRSGGCGVTLPR